MLLKNVKLSLDFLQAEAGSAMRVSRTIVRMKALPAEAQQKIIVKLHSFTVFHQDLCAPVLLSQ